MAEFDFAVEPVKFVAVIPYSLADALCPEHAMYCGGSGHTIKVPRLERRDERLMHVQLGNQTYPGLSGEALAADFADMLQGLGNVRSVKIAGKGRAPSRTGRVLIIRPVITEASCESEGSTTGMGPALLGATVLLNMDLSGAVEKTGYVRLDLSVVDPATGRIISAFPATGTYAGRYMSQHPFVFDWDMPKAYATRIIRSATRMAFHQATRKIADMLPQWEAQP